MACFLKVWSAVVILGGLSVVIVALAVLTVDIARTIWRER